MPATDSSGGEKPENERPRYRLKPKQFETVNPFPGTAPPSADHDVVEILKAVRAREVEAGIGELAEQPPRRSRRKRDFLILLFAGNAILLTLFCLEIFLGFQVMCLAAGMPGEFGGLLRYAVTEGRPMFAVPGLGMCCYSAALSWLVFGVMSDY